MQKGSEKERQESQAGPLREKASITYGGTTRTSERTGRGLCTWPIKIDWSSEHSSTIPMFRVEVVVVTQDPCRDASQYQLIFSTVLKQIMPSSNSSSIARIPVLSSATGLLR